MTLHRLRTLIKHIFVCIDFPINFTDIFGPASFSASPKCSFVFCFAFSGTISVNTIRTPYQAPGESEILDLDDHLYLGGLPENRAGLVFPTEVWTALLNYGFVGCVRDLFVDGQSKDVRRMAEAQKAVGVKPSCSKEAPKQCLSNPCQNNGICREGWNRYVCDCAATGFLGRSCERGGCLFNLLLTTCSLFPAVAGRGRGLSLVLTKSNSSPLQYLIYFHTLLLFNSIELLTC